VVTACGSGVTRGRRAWKGERALLLRIDYDPCQVTRMEIGRLWLDVDTFHGPWPTVSTVEEKRRRLRLGVRYRLLTSARSSPTASEGGAPVMPGPHAWGVRPCS
jgi:hypothetical protein